MSLGICIMPLWSLSFESVSLIRIRTHSLLLFGTVCWQCWPVIGLKEFGKTSFMLRKTEHTRLKKNKDRKGKARRLMRGTKSNPLLSMAVLAVLTIRLRTWLDFHSTQTFLHRFCNSSTAQVVWCFKNWNFNPWSFRTHVFLHMRVLVFHCVPIIPCLPYKRPSFLEPHHLGSHSCLLLHRFVVEIAHSWGCDHDLAIANRT